METSSRDRGSAIDLDDLTKHYPGAEHPAVNGVSLHIEPGEFMVLLGPSGCGKTTLLKMINRIYEPTSGTVTIDGVDVMSQSAPELRRKIGYVIQQSGLFPNMTIAENISVVPNLLKWNKQRTAARVRDLLVLTGLDPDIYAGRYPSQLSGGEQQRVGLARALAAEPPTMLMDEPFGALDAITRHRLQDELKQIHQKFSQTVVFVTHDIDEALQLADRIVVMRGGKVEQVGTPLDILRHPSTEFVSDLVGAGDVLRQFSLIQVRDAMQPIPENFDGSPRIAGNRTLREALSLLTDSDAPYLLVTDGDEVIGMVDYASMQHTAAGDKVS